MTEWTITITGSGPYNEGRASDVEQMAAKFVAQLKGFHAVERADVTATVLSTKNVLLPDAQAPTDQWQNSVERASLVLNHGKPAPAKPGFPFFDELSSGSATAKEPWAQVKETVSA